MNLADVQYPWGGQRFYPPGLHPAARRHRDVLARLQELGQGESRAAAYCQEWLAAFEQGESEAKRRYYERLRFSS